MIGFSWPAASVAACVLVSMWSLLRHGWVRMVQEVYCPAIASRAFGYELIDRCISWPYDANLFFLAGTQAHLSTGAGVPCPAQWPI